MIKEAVRRVRALPILVQDGVLAFVLMALSILSQVDHRPNDPKTDVWSYLLAVVGMGALTWRQSHIYRDAPTLYAATLARNPGCYLCLNNLGTLAARGGEMEEAARFYREAVRIKPDSPEAHNNLGSALAQSGKMAESLPHFEQAVRAAPNYVSARVNFGGVLFRMGRVAEAKAQFEAALRVMPDYGPARQNLAVIERLEAQGRPAP